MLYKNERLDNLNYHGVKIIQSDEVFSFSTDAILLSHFAWRPSKGKIIDLCAGNGAVALNIAHTTKAQIYLIELQDRLANMAKRSIAYNNLTEQLSVYNIDLKDSTNYLAKDSIDAILCNPPYFKNKTTNKQNTNPHLAIARHEITTNLAEIIKISSNLLKTKGHLSLVHRPERLIEIINLMQKYQIAPKRMRLVYPKPQAKANILLIEGIKAGASDGFVIENPLYIYDNSGNYTKEMQAIYHD